MVALRRKVQLIAFRYREGVHSRNTCRFCVIRALVEHLHAKPLCERVKLNRVKTSFLLCGRRLFSPLHCFYGGEFRQADNRNPLKSIFPL
nr:MAG TPA: hypothetical protein [Caudoviricetes sp.]